LDTVRTWNTLTEDLKICQVQAPLVPLLFCASEMPTEREVLLLALDISRSGERLGRSCRAAPDPESSEEWDARLAFSGVVILIWSREETKSGAYEADPIPSASNDTEHLNVFVG
jgi:hypothetical protein